MIIPGIFSISTPLILGCCLGTKSIIGYLVGLFSIGMIISLSETNTGSAWDNTKKMQQKLNSK